MKVGLGAANHDFLSKCMVIGLFSEGKHAFFSGQVMNNDRGDERNHDMLGPASLWKMKSHDSWCAGKHGS